MDAHYKAHNFRKPTFVIPTHIRLRQWGKSQYGRLTFPGKNGTMGSQSSKLSMSLQQSAFLGKQRWLCYSGLLVMFCVSVRNKCFRKSVSYNII
jgi:hypothetical protein